MVLNNSQYDEIMREYNRRQAIARTDLDRRTDEVLNVIPEYKDLMEQVSSISVASAIEALKNPHNNLHSLSDELHAIEQKMEDTLLSHGFPKDYLTIKYKCPKCKDTGYIDSEKCSCFKQAELDLLYNQSGIKDIISKQNFNLFNLDYYSHTYIDNSRGLNAYDNAKDVLATCKDFADSFSYGRSNGNILFYGDTGVGKTFLSNCIAVELLEKAFSVIYVSAIDLFDYFSGNYEHNNNTGLDNFSPEMQIINCDLLIIDDLGTELSNSFTNSKLFYCINNRLLADKSTIISTNCSLEDLMRNYSERIFSRISSSYKLLKLYGDDIRFLQNK